MKEQQTSQAGPDLSYTGERHMIAQPGIDLSLGHIDHMIRYASVSPFVTGKRVLDIACGSGYGSQFLALQGAGQIVGVDIDQTTIEYAQKCHAHPNVAYLRADAHAVPELEEASFDVIVSFETMEHVERPRDFLLELRRVLKPDGQCFISCPNDYRLSPWISEFHANRFKFAEFRDLIVLVFGNAIFLGQHNTCTSSLLKPRSVSEGQIPFEAYREPLPDGFFGNQYLDSISSIEDTAGYFAAIGIEASSFANQVSVSENSFQQMLTSMHFYNEEAKKAQNDTETAKQEITGLRQQVEAEKSLRVKLAARDHELAIVQQQMRTETERLRHERTQSEQQLSDLKNQVRTTQTESERLRHERTQSEQQLSDLKEQVRTIQTERERLRHERTQSEQQLSDLKEQVQQERILAEDLRARIAAMESSKFWKLRRMWFRLKGAVGLAAE